MQKVRDFSLYIENKCLCSSKYIYFNIISFSDLKKYFQSLKINYLILANIYLNQGNNVKINIFV